MTYLLVLLLAVISLGLLLAIYIYLVWRKALNQWHGTQKAHWLKVHSHDIETYLFTGHGGQSFAPVKEYQYEALEDTFSGFLGNFKFDKGFDPIGTFVEQYFVRRYRKRLRRGRWSERMNTLYFIDLFKIEAMQDELIRHLSSKRCSPEERYEIFLLLAEFEYKNLMELLKGSKDIPAFLLNELMSRLVHQDNVDEFADSFIQFSGSWQGAILEVIRDKNLRSDKLQLLLEHLITSEHHELRVKSLKTIAALGYVSNTDLIVQWMEGNIGSGHWDTPQAAGEKLMTARLMGSIRHETFIPFLNRLIGDGVYGVRSEAAKAIRQYKQGKELLQSIASSHADPYARSICQEWAERSLDYE